MSAVTSDEIARLRTLIRAAFFDGTDDVETASDAADYYVTRLLAIGRAQGLREAAGIAQRDSSVGRVFSAITAAAERAERGGGG